VKVVRLLRTIRYISLLLTPYAVHQAVRQRDVDEVEQRRLGQRDVTTGHTVQTDQAHALYCDVLCRLPLLYSSRINAVVK
jgi:hypothetical protein